MTQIPQEELRIRAKRLLDNDDLSVLLIYKLEELKQDVILGVDDAATLESKQEYQAVRNFAEWLSHLSGGAVTGGINLGVNRG